MLGRNLLRRVARSPPSLRGQKRLVGGHGSPEEIKEGMAWWKKVTYASLPLVAGALAINTALELMHHPHDGEGPVYSYMKIRNKPYPWGKGDCNFFDFKCRRKEE